jgi:L-glutamine:2-deoxy-scyllo-inosose/3-amino-2,3-dideoxy-scyllo-inosose aminotransferase
LLGQLTQATGWWATQPTWRVSSSHTGGGVIEALETFVAAEVAPDARALALPSGTTALLAALKAVGVRRGDRVGVPAVDWTASAAVLRALGATPVALPVDPVTGLLDPSAIRASVAGAADGHSSARITAVIAVHLHGLTCDVPPSGVH